MRDLLGRRALAVRAGRLEHAGELCKARLAHPRRGALLAELARADVGVAVAVRPEGSSRVVEVQRAEAVEADLGVEVVEDACEASRRGDVVARGVQVAGVEAAPEPLAAAARLEQRRQLAERAPERAARACGVLEMKR